MPLLEGYTMQTIRKNIREMRKAGKKEDVAVAAAYNKARENFKKKFPGKRLPKHLQK